MYKIIKILIVITLLLGSAITYINPIASAEEDSNWNKIKQRGELRVGLSADYAPLEFEKIKMVKLIMQVSILS